MHRDRRQRGRLRPCVATITVNLWDHELLQEWNTQINITAVQETHVFGKDIIRHYKKWSSAIQAVQEHKTMSKPSKIQMALPLK